MSKSLLKGVLLGLVVASTTAAEARDWGLKGAFLDSSQNLYTASYYPASANMRVSKRSSTNSSVWVHDFAAPSGWKFDRYFIVRKDSVGNVWVAAVQYQTSGTNTRFVIYKLNSSGNIVGTPTYYAPAPAGQACFLGGFAIDSADKPILVGSYNTGNSIASNGFAVKYTTYPSTFTAHTISIASQFTFADDVQIDASNNVFVSSFSMGSTDYATITKFTSAFTAGTNYSDVVPTGWYTNNGGCLTLDSSGRLTYLIRVSNSSSALDVFGTQRNTSGTLTWTPGLLGLTSMDTNWSTVDASGNIYVTGGTTGFIEVAKISPTKTILWDNVISPATPMYPNMIALDAGGDPLVVTSTTGTGGTGSVARVMRFNNSTGVLSTSYNYSGAGGFDYGHSIFPSSTTGVFYVAGVGNSGGTYYPLTYKYTVGGSPAVTWSDYQTAIIP